MLKKIGLATCLASVAWFLTVLGLSIGEGVFSISWTYTETLVKFPFGVIALLVVIIVFAGKLSDLALEEGYVFCQFVAASFLTGILCFFVIIVFGVDLTEIQSGSITESVILLSIIIFSLFLVLGFCKLWKIIRNNLKNGAV